MRIHDAYTKLDRTAVRTDKADGPKGTARDAKGSAPSTTPAASDGITIAVSAKARALADAADVSGNPRVAELRAKVQAGTLAIDAQKIAAKLLGGDAP